METWHHKSRKWIGSSKQVVEQWGWLWVVEFNKHKQRNAEDILLTDPSKCGLKLGVITFGPTDSKGRMFTVDPQSLLKSLGLLYKKEFSSVFSTLQCL